MGFVDFVFWFFVMIALSGSVSVLVAILADIHAERFPPPPSEDA
jgi:hypothetical protein